MNDSIVYILISIGLVFEIVGCIGLVRMPTVYNRIQASTKCVTIGTCFILAGIAVQAFFSSEMGGAVGLKAIICLVFILLTAPTGAHAIARAAHRLLNHGLEVRHLRTIRIAADRQTDLLGQLVAPLLRHRNPENRHRAAETLADCAQAAAVLQESITRGRLRGLLER